MVTRNFNGDGKSHHVWPAEDYIPKRKTNKLTWTLPGEWIQTM